jgi:hypothetical protein
MTGSVVVIPPQIAVRYTEHEKQSSYQFGPGVCGYDVFGVFDECRKY